MYMLMTITDGQKQNYVASTRKALKAYMKKALVWRLHDGNGWCDASADTAWKSFSGAVGHSFIYVI